MSQSSNCSRCKTKFGWFKSKRTCDRCKLTYCQNCATNRFVCPQLGYYDSTEMCLQCVNTIKEMLELQALLDKEEQLRVQKEKEKEEQIQKQLWEKAERQRDIIERVESRVSEELRDFSPSTHRKTLSTTVHGPVKESNEPSATKVALPTTEELFHSLLDQAKKVGISAETASQVVRDNAILQTLANSVDNETASRTKSPRSLSLSILGTPISVPLPESVSPVVEPVTPIPVHGVGEGSEDTPHALVSERQELAIEDEVRIAAGDEELRKHRLLQRVKELDEAEMRKKYPSRYASQYDDSHPPSPIPNFPELSRIDVNSVVEIAARESPSPKRVATLLNRHLESHEKARREDDWVLSPEMEHKARELIRQEALNYRQHVASHGGKPASPEGQTQESPLRWQPSESGELSFEDLMQAQVSIIDKLVLPKT